MLEVFAHARHHQRVRIAGHDLCQAADARAPLHPARVSYRSYRAIDDGAYGVRFVRAAPRDADAEAFVDIEKRDDGVHVISGRGVSQIVLLPGALGAKRGEAVHGGTGSHAPVTWAETP